jgi:hypothetical protein
MYRSEPYGRGTGRGATVMKGVRATSSNCHSRLHTSRIPSRTLSLEPGLYMDIFTVVRTSDHVKPRTFPSLEMQVRHTFFSLVHLALGAPNVPRPLVTSPAKLIISYMLVQAHLFSLPRGIWKRTFLICCFTYKRHTCHPAQKCFSSKNSQIQAVTGENLKQCVTL